MGKHVTDSELLTALQELASDLEKTPTTQEMTDHGPYSHSLYYSRFDSWGQALERAGLTEESRDHITDRKLLDELKRLAEELGRPPTIAEMDSEGAYSVSTYYRRFESWLDAREAAGLIGTEIHPSSHVSDSDLLAEIRHLATDLDRIPTTTDMDRHGEFGLRTYYTRFDGWNSALEAAGVKK